MEDLTALVPSLINARRVMVWPFFVAAFVCSDFILMSFSQQDRIYQDVSLSLYFVCDVQPKI